MIKGVTYYNGWDAEIDMGSKKELIFFYLFLF